METTLKDETHEVKYESGIQYLPISKIIPNQFNPRQRFNEEEEDELIQSIIEKGILNPIIVYKKTDEDNFVILDGERRYRACKKLPSIHELPARVLLKEPNKLESLSIMFHIHHVQKDWTQFAISMTLIEIIREKGMDPKNLTQLEKKELVKITSLSEYKINKFLIFQEYPDEVIKRFLRSEIEGDPESGADPDILLEMYRPIRQMRQLMPEIFDKYPIPKIIDSCIKKKAREVIKTNKEFRFISKCLTAAKVKRANPARIKEEIIGFINNINTTPESIYKKTAEAYYQIDSVNKSVEALIGELNDLNLANITHTDKAQVTDRLKNLLKIIESRFDI
jgi:ParB family transcriptional regulator, chromosome partitioning protein